MKKLTMRNFLGANYILLFDLVARCQVHLVCENQAIYLRYVQVNQAIYLGYVHLSVCVLQ